MKKLLAITALSAALFFGQTAAAEEKAAEEVKPSHVEMVLVLDESGSMSDLTRDTIGGFNSMIENHHCIIGGAFFRADCCGGRKSGRGSKTVPCGNGPCP